MKIKTTRFGELSVPAECIIRFVSCLAGFPRHKRFALFPYEENSPFNILQSVSNPDLTFLLVDPYRFFNGYIFELEDDLAEEFGFSAENAPGVYALTTLHDKIDDATVNLLGPILVNWDRREAAQVTLHNSSFAVRQPLFPQGLDLDRKRSGKRNPARQNLESEIGLARQEAIG
jgi:flagellar assembly factor FliW